MIEALDDWILDSEFVKNPPSYDFLPDPAQVKGIDSTKLKTAISIAKRSSEINIDSTHWDHIILLVKILDNML